MQSLLGTALRWLVRHLVSLALIVAILMFGRMVWSEWKEWQSIRDESAQLDADHLTLGASFRKLGQAAEVRAATLAKAPLIALEARITEVDSEIARKQLEREQYQGIAPILEGQPIARVQVLRLQVDGAISLLEKERDWLQAAKRWRIASPSRQQQSDELKRLHQNHKRIFNELLALDRELAELKNGHWIRSRLLGTNERERRSRLEEQRAQKLAENNAASEAHRLLYDAVKRSDALRPPEALSLTTVVDELLRPLSSRIGKLNNLAQANKAGQIWLRMKEVLPSALTILLGVVLTPVAIKALFYFVLAPLAARRPPIQLLPTVDGALSLEGGSSSVSRAITVDSRHELLVHPEFLQSTSIAGEKTTKWLLDGHFPLTSLSAGMVALTRIRSEVPASFVISATHDPLAEIGILNLPAGSAVVMQPHNLVGVVQSQDAPLRITSHWRLSSLHAWLTLQLRYLALHGPVRLIVQGSRGVQMERATGSRAINQAATIAFSANVAYSTRRCETFSAYLLGKQELLNDCFAAVPVSEESSCRATGSFVYQQTPYANRKTGINGRGIEGLTDSLLKVLGI